MRFCTDLGLTVHYVVADKGYDSEENRRYVRYQMKAETHILVRKAQAHALQQHGLLRLRQLRIFDKDVYHRRELVETVHSVLKRTMKGSVSSRLE